MQIVIDIPETQWDWLHNGFLDEDDGKYAINAILKGTPLPKTETVTEFADRCRECGARYGEQLKKLNAELKEWPPRIEPDNCGNYVVMQPIVEAILEDQEDTEIDFIQPKKIVGKLISVEVLDKIRAEIECLHYHPKLDFIKNDEVVDMALDVIDKHIAEGSKE